MEAERQRVCGLVERQARRAGIVLGSVLVSTLAVFALVAGSGILRDPIVLVVTGGFALVPSIVALTLFRARRHSLRFLRRTSPLLIDLDEQGGLLVLSDEGVYRERPPLFVEFVAESGREGFLVRVRHETTTNDVHRLCLVLLWRAAPKRPMTEQETSIAMPRSVTPARAMAIGQELASRRECAFHSS